MLQFVAAFNFLNNATTNEGKIGKDCIFVL